MSAPSTTTAIAEVCAQDHFTILGFSLRDHELENPPANSTPYTIVQNRVEARLAVVNTIRRYLREQAGAGSDIRKQSGDASDMEIFQARIQRLGEEIEKELVKLEQLSGQKVAATHAALDLYQDRLFFAQKKLGGRESIRRATFVQAVNEQTAKKPLANVEPRNAPPVVPKQQPDLFTARLPMSTGIPRLTLAEIKKDPEFKVLLGHIKAGTRLFDMADVLARKPEYAPHVIDSILRRAVLKPDEGYKFLLSALVPRKELFNVANVSAFAINDYIETFSTNKVENLNTLDQILRGRPEPFVNSVYAKLIKAKSMIRNGESAIGEGIIKGAINPREKKAFRVSISAMIGVNLFDVSQKIPSRWRSVLPIRNDDIRHAPRDPFHIAAE